MKKSKKVESKTLDEKTKVLVNVILDRSGSMATGRDGTIDGYNEYLKGLKADNESDYSVSLIQFDTNRGPELTVSYVDTPVNKVPVLDQNGYVPRGGTPLYDAIGECVGRVEAKGRAVICVVITDGEENSSRDFSLAKIQGLIKEKETAGWKFVFLGADINSYQVGGSIGVSVGATANYTKGNESALYANMAEATRGYTSNIRSVGLRAANSMSFFADSQKSAMDQAYQGSSPTTTGGRPAAPATFPSFTVTVDNQKPADVPTFSITGSGLPATGSRWKVSNDIPDSGGSGN